MSSWSSPSPRTADQLGRRVSEIWAHCEREARYLAVQEALSNAQHWETKEELETMTICAYTFFPITIVAPFKDKTSPNKGLL